MIYNIYNKRNCATVRGLESYWNSNFRQNFFRSSISCKTPLNLTLKEARYLMIRNVSSKKYRIIQNTSKYGRSFSKYLKLYRY